jgi:hypothetical protein
LPRFAPADSAQVCVTDSVDLKLAKDINRFYADPLGFVLYAFPWDTDPSLQLVKLPAPWCFYYDSTYGPDKWACELLTRVGETIKAHGFDGVQAVEAVREAVASGHGIGKSALVSWLVWWIMSTRPHCRGTVTATTNTQLSTKTWAEISKWHKKCITEHWFTVTTARNDMRAKHKQYPESWFCSAQTSEEQNSESFAGQHAADSTSFYIFDEATGIPNAIWDVAEGGLTDGEPMWFAFGNPTRNTGRFAECFGKSRHRWNITQVDSREAQITNKADIQRKIDDYGIDSDFCKVRIRGVFPSSSSLQLIPRDVVDGAATRDIKERTLVRGRAAIVGVDVARFGDDESVIRTRVGRDARSIAPKAYRQLDTMQLASRVAEHIEDIKRMTLVPFVFVDGGGVGGGVIDRLRQLGYQITEVNFGEKPIDPKRYANKRSEMWVTMSEWLTIGAIENSELLLTDLTAVEYDYDKSQRLLLKSKDDMKARGLASPDHGDALALTFAAPVPDYPNPELELITSALRAGGAQRKQKREHDPFDLME